MFSSMVSQHFVHTATTACVTFYHTGFCATLCYLIVSFLGLGTISCLVVVFSTPGTLSAHSRWPSPNGNDLVMQLSKTPSLKPRKPLSGGVTIDKLFNFSKPAFSSDNEDNMTNTPNGYRNEMEYSVYTALSRSSVNGIYHYSCYCCC